MKKSNLAIGIIVSLIVIGMFSYEYYEPNLISAKLMARIDADDAAGAGKYIDFPKLRESVDANIKLGNYLHEGRSGGETSAQEWDTFITPEGFGLAIQSLKFVYPRVKVPLGDEDIQVGGGPSLLGNFEEKLKDGRMKVKSYYAGLNEFDLEIALSEKEMDQESAPDTEPINIVYCREGFSWKLCALKLPMTLLKG